MRPDRKTVAVGVLVLVAVGVLGWGVYSSMGQSLPADRVSRRVADNPELRALMESQRQERDEWMVRFAQASPADRRLMLLEQQAQMQERAAQWQARRAERPEGDRPPRPEGEQRPDQPNWRSASPEERAERMAGGNPQRQALRSEMWRTMREYGIEPPHRGRGGGGR